MKVVITFGIFAFIAWSAVKQNGRDYVYITGEGWKECEAGTSSYESFCGPMTPEATCDEPHPVPGEGDVCDYSVCYCNAPTVRDTESDKCVKLEDCPPKKDNKDQEDKKE